MPEVEVVDAQQLDYEAYCRLQREAFAELLAERGVSDAFMTPAFFRWKYAPPAGHGKVAVVHGGDGRYVAANAMFPLVVRHEGGTLLGWQSCDTATAPDARGRGCFKACLNGLVEALGEDELFFGFPNHNSMRGFQKLGWTESGEVTTWAMMSLLPSPALRMPSEVEVVQHFGAQLDLLDARLCGGEGACLQRDARYLNWRYADHPLTGYTLLIHRVDQQVDGFAVLRRARAMNREVTLVMDLWGDGDAERTLVRAIRAWAWKALAPFCVILRTGWRRRDALRTGFVPVPQRLLPKRQVLMGMGTGARSSAALAAAWRVQTGDWDAF